MGWLGDFVSQKFEATSLKGRVDAFITGVSFVKPPIGVAVILLALAPL